MNKTTVREMNCVTVEDVHRLRERAIELEAENDKIREENEDLSLSYESLSQTFGALSQDAREYRDEAEALAAHVGEVTRVFLEGFESGDDHDLDAWENDAKQVLARQPKTSLARIRAEAKAQALSECLPLSDPSCDHFIRMKRNEYRQQAEGES